MSSAFADMIFTGTVREFYARERAEEFVAIAEERDYECEIREQPGEDLRWRVHVIGKKPPPPKKKK